jgi:hypothetical protein
VRSAGLGLGDELVDDVQGRVPLAGVVPVEPLFRSERLDPVPEPEALAILHPLVVQLAGPANVSQQVKDRREVQVPAAHVPRRAGLLGDGQAGFQILEAAAVSPGRPGHADVVQRVGPKVGQAQRFRHPQHLPPQGNGFLVAAGQRQEP